MSNLCKMKKTTLKMHCFSGKIPAIMSIFCDFSQRNGSLFSYKIQIGRVESCESGLFWHRNHICLHIIIMVCVLFRGEEENIPVAQPP